MVADKKKTNLLIIEERDVMRQGLESILKDHDDIRVVGSTASPAEAIKQIGDLHPQIVLLGLRRSEDQEIIDSIAPDDDTRVLLLASPNAGKEVAAAFKSGASGCLLTDVMAEDLIETIRLVAKGKMVLPQNIARETLVERRKRPRSASTISAREMEVLQLMANGLRNKEIAAELHLSEVTIKTHVSKILKKLGKKSRMSAILEANRKGWVTLP